MRQGAEQRGFEWQQNAPEFEYHPKALTNVWLSLNYNNTEVKIDANISESFTALRTISHLTWYFVVQEIQFVHFPGPIVY